MDPNNIDRRAFVKGGGLGLLTLGMAPHFLQRSLLASTNGLAKKKTLICIFQRGAVDGLNMVVPFGEKSYYEKRRAIALNASDVIDLNGFFGLHPELRPLHDLFKRNELSVVHAVGSPDSTRSHFDAQDYMESATPGVKTTRDGWLNRVLTDTRSHARDHALRGIAMGAELPHALRGPAPSLVISDLQQFSRSAAELQPYAETKVFGSAADGAMDALQILRRANPLQYQPAANVTYPNGEFGRSLKQIAQLIKSDVGVEIAFADIGGWDTHQAQGAVQGRMANQLRELAGGIRALYDDLGDRMNDVVILTMSEFGRTVAENGSGGTDHGHANCMFVAGGAVNGGRVLGDWPGLATEQLYEARDLAVTTDFRDVFSEIAARHLGATAMSNVFPGYTVQRECWRGTIR